MLFRQRSELLTFEEIERLVTIFSRFGVKRVRLTGGEPTVRADVVSLVARLSTVDGIEKLVMTSNGHRFPELAKPLADAGLSEVNISLDTLDPVLFRELTRRGDLDRVIEGMEAALAAGLVVKLNAVALRGVNDGEVAAICAFAWERGITPRFIEHMPMSGGQLYASDQQLTAQQIRDAVSEHFTRPVLAEVQTESNSGPSRYYMLDDPEPHASPNSPPNSFGHVGQKRRFGIISAMSEHFCDTCNRLRLSAAGELHPCLAYDDAVSLRDVIRAGGSDDDVRRVIFDALAGKREGHQFQVTGAGAPIKHMIGIGG